MMFDTSADDDKERIKSVFHSAKKFTLRYVLHVSILIRPKSGDERFHLSDAEPDCVSFHLLQGLSRLP